MKKYQNENDSSVFANIFFIPKKKEELMVDSYVHTGVIFNEKVYEILDHGRPSITPISKRMPELKKEKALFVETKICPEKLDQEINSGTNCQQYVVRVMGMSNLKGSETGNFRASDVYKMIKRKKQDY